MAISYLERLATLGTGRLGVESIRPRRDRLVLFPSYVEYEPFIRVSEHRDVHDFFIEYKPTTWTSPSAIRIGVRLLARLIKLTACCDEIVLYRFHEKYDSFCLFLTAITARLIGIPVTLCDYSFPSAPFRKQTRRLHALSRRIELGDTTGLDVDAGNTIPVSIRIDAEDMTAYCASAKTRPVPSVLVYGDFDYSTTRSLVGRAYDLVKQKYPRTEFRLVSPALPGEYETPDERVNGSFVYCYPRTEKDMRALFSTADILMLVSPGGLNRYFISLARAAGYPIIVNGLDYSEESSSNRLFLSAARGSYTGLAQAVISLVDDDNYYRSFRAE